MSTLRYTLAILLCLFASSALAGTIPEDIDAALDTSATIRPYEWGILFEDESGSTEYYSRNPDAAMIPASNTKIFTTAAAFGILGTDYEFRTRIYRTTGSVVGSVFTGNIVLLGEHDPTWNTSTFGSGNSDAALQIAAAATVQALNAQGITQVTGRVEGYGAMAYNLGSTNLGHQSLSASNIAELNRQAAVAFRAALIDNGLAFTSVINSAGFTGLTPNPAWISLHTHYSGDANYLFTGRPLLLEEACVPLNKVSHNVMADLMLRHIGYVQTGTDSYGTGESQVFAWMAAETGVSTAGMNMNDGSGISGGNRFTARQTVDLVRYMAAAYPSWVTTLPISCVDGTIGGRLCGTLTGDVRAKTGTLPSTGAVSLSGLMDHPLDGTRYFFSIYVNTPGADSGGQAIDTTLSRNAMDNAIRVIGERIPPFSPALLAARSDGPQAARLEWADPAHNLNGFRVAWGDAPVSLPNQSTVLPVYIIESGRDDTSLGLNNSDYSDTGAFENSASHSAAPGLTVGIGSRFIRPTNGTGTAVFAPSALPSGRYRVDVTCYDFLSAEAPNTQATIVDRRGSRSSFFELSEQTAGDVWRVVGEIDFVAGQNHRVEFRNNAQTATADANRMNPAAVRFTPLFFADAPVAAGTVRHYGVSGIGPRGIGGETSDVYAIRQGITPTCLVVDGYDRWTVQSQNPDRQNHAFAARTGASIPRRAFDSVANEALTDGIAALGSYRTAVWVLGEESTADETFSAAEQSLVSSFLGGGGGLFLSGAEILWDLDRTSGPTADDRAFAQQFLHAEYDDTRSDGLNDDAATFQASVVPGTFLDGIGSVAFDDGSGDSYPVEFPDVLAPVGSGSFPVMTYSGGTSPGLPAATAYDGSAGGGRVVFLGFPFETIQGAQTRDDLMAASMDFLDPETSFNSDVWILFGQ